MKTIRTQVELDPGEYIERTLVAVTDDRGKVIELTTLQDLADTQAQEAFIEASVGSLEYTYTFQAVYVHNDVTRDLGKPVVWAWDGYTKWKII